MASALVFAVCLLVNLSGKHLFQGGEAGKLAALGGSGSTLDQGKSIVNEGLLNTVACRR